MLITLITIPLIASLLSFMVRRRVWILEAFVVTASALELGAVLKTISFVLMNGPIAGGYFYVDALSSLLLLVISIIGFAASAYSVGYLREEVVKGIIGFRRVRQFYVLLHLFLFAMFFAVITSNPIMMWVAIEATTLSTAFLISFYNKPSSMEAAWKYLIINSLGLLLAFFGTLLFLSAVKGTASSGYVDWRLLFSSAGGLDPIVAKMAFICVLIGYGTKVGLAPMHTWLPDAHSKAPAPISSLLSGVLLNVALFAVLRFKIVTDSVVGFDFSKHLLVAFGVFSIAVAALIIFGQKNYKRLLAYSSIEHMGIIALGFGFGGIGIFGALLHMLYHALTKSILFFSAGNIFLKYSSTQIRKVAGVITTMPVTGILFLIGFLSIAGVPPFGIFMTEFYIVSAGIASHPWITGLALFFLALVFIGLLIRVSSMTFGKTENMPAAAEKNDWTIIPPITLIFILIALSFYLPAPIRELLNAAANLFH